MFLLMLLLMPILTKQQKSFIYMSFGSHYLMSKKGKKLHTLLVNIDSALANTSQPVAVG